MPLYDYECHRCGSVREHYAKIDETEGTCDECGGNTQRILTSRYSVNAGNFDYVEENLGPKPVRINGREHLEQVMREQKVSARSPKGKEWW